MEVQVKSAVILAVLTFGVMLTSCTHRVPVTVSSGQPAATSELKVTKDDNNNTKLKLTVRNLAKPTRLLPARKTYVVWIQRDDSSPEILGQLQVDDHLKGEFETVTPHKRFDLLVTAEDSPTPEFPSDERVMRARVDAS
jgi:hypothetical protein